jgi:hypothetical protein
MSTRRPAVRGKGLQLIAFIAEATVAKRILGHLGLDSRGPPLARAQAPPDLLDAAPSHDGIDHTPSEQALAGRARSRPTAEDCPLQGWLSSVRCQKVRHPTRSAG